MFKGWCAVAALFAVVSYTAQASDSSSTKLDNLQLLTELQRIIERDYVLEDKIESIVASLASLKTQADFVAAQDAEGIAQRVTDTLKPFDRHFGVRVMASSDSEMPKEGYFDSLARRHSGVRRVEILPGNVGYLALDGFDRLNPRSRKRLSSAMAVLEEADALIFDLRENGGGSPNMVALLSSYLFEKRTHLNTLYTRSTDTYLEFWTERPIEGKRIPDVPVYVLTSQNTFSAAEEFAYNLQSYKRAIVVGEVSGGGAHPIRSITLQDTFVAHIPYAKAINPVTQSNWEWVGVQPDVPVPAAKALKKAHQLALAELSGRNVSVFEKRAIDQAMEAVSLSFSTEKTAPE